MRPKKPQQNRLAYFDNIRALMIVCVVLMHVAVTYSGFGMWYYQEARNLDFISSLIFALFQTFLQAFFMSLLFMIAGYFSACSVDKKTTVQFIGTRLFRLGIPTLLYILVIHPWCVKLTHPSLVVRDYVIRGVKTGEMIAWTGPLWFAAALLIFSILYVGMRAVWSRIPLTHVPYSFKNMLIITGIITMIAFFVRLVFPLGSAVYNFQLGYFTAYLGFFILGVLSYRNRSLDGLDYTTGRKCICVSCVLGLPYWCALMLFGGPAKGSFFINGGWHWQAFAFALWESFVCVTVSIGLIGIFKEKFNTQNRVQKFLSAHAFGVYVFHAPIVIGISLLLKGMMLYPLLKFFLVSVIAVPSCFMVSWMIKRVPGFQKVFS